MSLDAALLHALTKETPETAWAAIIAAAWSQCSQPLAKDRAPAEITKRDRQVEALDHFLSTSGWDLWPAFGTAVERTSERLVRWWAQPFGAKAVLILDGMSLRELPWLLQGAKEHGFTVHDASASGSELPGETDGREGINLQFARILFNFDLPWNPMDLEQRIGRIHRYGQLHTAQVYNLVLSDTIEGRIFLLLDEKLSEIARALGKVDEQGNVAEDLRAQILGQLSERLSYDRLYQEALSDPELKRTKVELEAALANAREAREVVFDLFQDLEGFSLDDYKPFSDVSSGLERLVKFLSAALTDRQQRVVKVNDQTYDILSADGQKRIRFTLDRDTATSRDDVELLGLDHPVVQEEMGRWRNLVPEDVGISVVGDQSEPISLSFWLVETSAGKGERRILIQAIAVKPDGTRVPATERQAEKMFSANPGKAAFIAPDRSRLITQVVEPMLQRELKHKGVAVGDGSYSAELIGYVEINSK